MTRLALFALLMVLACGCGGGGQYGFARVYSPLGEEQQLLPSVTETSFEEVRRDPADFRSQTLAWFGVVTSVELDASTGVARVACEFRTHQERHLCADETDGSCRVTVSDHVEEPYPFTAVVTVRPEDRDGRDRLWIGSLVRIYGSPTGEFDAQGGPVLEGRYYRHWPRGTFVTTADRVRMLR